MFCSMEILTFEMDSEYEFDHDVYWYISFPEPTIFCCSDDEHITSMSEFSVYKQSLRSKVSSLSSSLISDCAVIG
jgi:hypothetical protein